MIIKMFDENDYQEIKYPTMGEIIPEVLTNDSNNHKITVVKNQAPALPIYDFLNSLMSMILSSSLFFFRKEIPLALVCQL